MSRPLILVVDDEPDIVDSLCMVLKERLDADVLGAGSGSEALQMLEQVHPDLIICDFRMPRMDGIAVLARARVQAPDVPRILLTAYADMELAIRAVNEAAIVRLISKPVNAVELGKMAAEVLALGRTSRRPRQALERATRQLHRRDGDSARAKG